MNWGYKKGSKLMTSKRKYMKRMSELFEMRAQ